MKKKEFVAKARNIAQDYKTLYVMGGWGGCLHAKGKTRAYKNAYNTTPDRKPLIEAADGNTFGFDCVGLIKTILWGWCGDMNPSYSYGGASAKSNGVPDVGADNMIKLCTDVSEDFGTIDVGEMVWMSGHCGIYLGGGIVAEATPKWDDGVQLTACLNLGEIEELNGRVWTSHGRLPWVDYTPEPGDAVRIVGVDMGRGDNLVLQYKRGGVIVAAKEEKE